jgi:hypothetical protein
VADETQQNKEATGKTTPEPASDEILTQIREDWRYVREYWRENHEESEKDMDVVACIPPRDFTEDRKGRPCIWPDETSQYIKQANNNLRKNKRSVKISPRSQDAKDADAEHRQAYIRGIEYASKAQSIYTTGFESAVQCGFGYWRLKLEVVGRKGEQEPRLARIPNWATVFPDPDAREADFSDQNICFVMDQMRQATFARKYPKAQKRSFSPADAEVAPGWLSGQDIVVAEYWTRKEHDDDDAKRAEDKDGLKRYQVKQRITNGLEILDTYSWIGSWIPIIGVFGEEIYVRSSGQSKRMFMSLIRRARGPQTMLAYTASQEAEEFGLAPRAPLQGYKGQFDPKKHSDIHKVPRAYVEFNIPADWNVNWGPPPMPTRPQFMPNAEAYELAFERWRRSIQSAMGIAPLPTSAQRQNEKSGVALEKIQDQEAIGSFHFTDNFVRALGNTGRQANELITLLADLDSLPKQLLGRDQKDEDLQLHVAPKGQSGEISEELPEGHQWFFAHRGEFEVSAGDGPNYESEREECSEFADHLLEMIPQMGLPPQITTQMLAIAVKLKNIGTFGDEIADLLSPPDPNNLPPAAKAILAQMNAQLQQAQQEVMQLKLEKLGKVTEIHGKMALAKQEHITRMTEADKDRETKLAVAEVSTKAQSVSERLAMIHDLMQQFHDQAHELGLQMQQHDQAKELAAQQAEDAKQQQQTQIAHEQQQSAAAQEPAAAGQ